jgi:hypothetical protein
VATINITGTILDQYANPVVGMSVLLREFVGASYITRDTTTTNASGYYALSYTYTTMGDFFVAEPYALAPHYSDPGSGAHRFTAGSYVDNFTSTFSNSTPTTTTMSNRSFVQSSGSYTGDFTQTDADGDTMTATKVSGASWGTVSQPNASTGRWTWDTAGVAPGDYFFEYRTVDQYGLSSAIRVLIVTITAANTPPVLTSPGNKTYLNKDGTKTFQLSATDVDGDPLTYSKPSGPSWVTCPSSGLVSVNTDAATRAVHSVTFRASDGRGGTDDKTITITIQNNPPVLTNPGNQQYTTNTGNKTVQLNATDVDGDTKTYSKTAGPTWGSVNSSTGLVTFAIGATVAGTYSFTFQVSDGQGGTDSESFDVVLVDPVPAPFFQMQG